MKKIYMINIAGESGSGKTEIANFLSKKWCLPTVESYTTREPRYDGETGHEFGSWEEAIDFPEEEKILKTSFGGHLYFCRKSKLENINVYVIDEKGILEMKEKYSDIFKIINVRVNTREKLRLERLREEYSIKMDPESAEKMAEERICRDKKQFNLNNSYYDFIIENNGTKTELYGSLDKLVRDIFEKSKNKE